jgi:hypothetical protein
VVFRVHIFEPVIFMENPHLISKLNCFSGKSGKNFELSPATPGASFGTR